jgi:hypothetical protein
MFYFSISSFSVSVQRSLSRRLYFGELLFSYNETSRAGVNVCRDVGLDIWLFAIFPSVDPRHYPLPGPDSQALHMHSFWRGFGGQDRARDAKGGRKGFQALRIMGRAIHCKTRNDERGE